MDYIVGDEFAYAPPQIKMYPMPAWRKELLEYAYKGGGMAIEVKKPKKDECSCGHPLTKEAAQKKHEEEKAQYNSSRVWDELIRLGGRIGDLAHQLEQKEHRHWWQ